jgi:hypothetical protein
MAPLSLDRSLNVTKVCNEIISIISGIYFVSVINKNGRMIYTKQSSDNNTKNLTQEELEMLYMQRVLQTCMNKEFDKKLGLLHYTISGRDAMLEFIFPFDTEIIFIATNNDISIQHTVKQILELCRGFELKTKMEIGDEIT